MLVALELRMEDELILDQVRRARRTQGIRAKPLGRSRGRNHLWFGRLNGQSQHGCDLLNIFLRQFGNLPGLQHTNSGLLATDLCCKGGLSQPLFAAGLGNLLANLNG